MYLRKSRAEDGVQDLEKHKNYLLEIIKRNGWTYELYEEIDSSQDLFRDELQRLRKDIALQKVDAVMVHAVDRLSRRSRHFLEIIEDYFIEEGMYKLYVKDTEHDLRDTTTITMLQLQATLSQAEYSFIVSRLNDGRRASVKKGIVTGKLVYGYVRDRDTKLAVPHKEEAKVVRMIVDGLLEGKASMEICTYLNDLGYRTRQGRFWAVHNIKSIIDSPVTRGHVIQKWGDEVIEVLDNHEPLMTEAEYSTISKMLENKAENFKNLSAAPKHFLQGLLRCPKCDRVMTFAATKPKRKKVGDKVIRYGEYVYYVRTCRPYIKHMEKCGNWGAQAVLVEDTVRIVIKQYQHQIEANIENLMNTESEDVKASKRNQVNEYKKAIEKIESKEKVWLDMVGSNEGFDVKTIFDQVRSLKEEKSELLQKLSDAKADLRAVDIEHEIEQQEKLRDVLDQWDSLDDVKKRSTLQTLFKKITYSRFDKDTPPILDFIPNK